MIPRYFCHHSTHKTHNSQFPLVPISHQFLVPSQSMWELFRLVGYEQNIYNRHWQMSDVSLLWYISFVVTNKSKFLASLHTHVEKKEMNRAVLALNTTKREDRSRDDPRSWHFWYFREILHCSLFVLLGGKQRLLSQDYSRLLILISI